jgi:hypothetical protein
VALVEYLGVAPQHVTHHGNAKHPGDYVRSLPRVLEAVQDQCVLSKAKPLHIYQDRLLHCDSDLDYPRNLKQVQNAMAQTKSASSDGPSSRNPANAFQKLCSSVISDPFVQSVVFTKGPQAKHNTLYTVHRGAAE